MDGVDAGTGGDDAGPGSDGGTADPDSGPIDQDAGPVPAHVLRSGIGVTIAEVYTAVNHEPGFGISREYLPRDLAAHPNGDLWVVQQMERDPAFDDFTECTNRGIEGDPNDCVSQQGSTVTISDPGAASPATQANGRARIVMDANAWHFMRRPAAIAFGARELRLEPGDPGAEDTGITETAVFVNTFATCHEHWTGNPTDMPAFIGPTLWTSDPSIYNGVNGSFDWSNGSHLDMVHATQYCMGIAYERANVYWTLNGTEGVLDRYDFGAPHYPGHHDHGDGDVTRYTFADGDAPVRVPTVPSNMVLDGNDLFIADTGNGRVLRVDLTSPTTVFGSFFTFEFIEGEIRDGIAYQALQDQAGLSAEWGGAAEPSGLALLDRDTLVVANHATGHLTLLERADGSVIRTIDTGTGSGLGGVTAIDGVLYFVQMAERRIYRVDPIGG